MLRIRQSYLKLPFTCRCFVSGRVLKSGHNKWSSIKHDKMKNDSQKNMISNKYSNQITVAVKLKDPQLQALLDKAAKNNVPKKVIENAIKKGEGINPNGSGINMTMNQYEGVGPKGCNIIVESMTDNKNRTVALVRGQFNKYGYNMTSTGSSLHYFDKVGIVRVSRDGPEIDDSEEIEPLTEEEVMDKVIEIDGIIDVKRGPSTEGEESIDIITEPSDTNRIALKVRELGYSIESAGIEYVAKEESVVKIDGAESQEAYNKFINGLESLDDVIKVYTNAQL
ncbi:hypothetical protein MOSE0_D04852 [Monosporozyma servazzii]